MNIPALIINGLALVGINAVWAYIVRQERKDHERQMKAQNKKWREFVLRENKNDRENSMYINQRWIETVERIAKEK